MRIAIVVGLAIIAVLAGGVWALGQFGGGGEAAIVSERPPPVVREPEIVAAVTPQQTGPAARKAPAPTEPDAPANPDAPPATPSTPTQPSPFSTLNPGAPATPTTPSTPSEAPATPPAEAELRVGPQNVPAAAATTTDAQPTSLEAQFKSRRLTYNRPPATLALDKAIDISLIIDTSRQTDAAERLQGLPGTIVERDVDLSDTVAAELLGAAFDIQLQTTSPRQKLSAKLANEWRWRVTPKQKGTHVLTLNVYGYAVGSSDAEPLDSYRDAITVQVEAVDELVGWARGVQPLFGVIAGIAGIGSATFAFLRFREERKANRAQQSNE